MNSLEFLDSYWKKAKQIEFDICENLPKKETKNKTKKIGNFLFVTQYSNLDTWCVNDLINSKHQNLVILADKISHMIKTNKSDSIKPMLEKIVTGRVKSLFKVHKQDVIELYGKRTYLGSGHFRWGEQAINLSDEEIQQIKKYFKL